MSERRLVKVATVLALVGLAIAAYLTYVHYRGIEPVCAASGGCEKVQSSKWAEVAGVPVALLGLIGYACVLVALRVPGDAGRNVFLLLTLGGVGFSAWLTYLELFEIEASCQWCLASAVVMTALLGLAGVRWVRAAD